MVMIHPKVFTFSHRLILTERFEEWADAHQVKKDPVSFLAFLETYHLLDLCEVLRFVDPALSTTTYPEETEEERKARTIKKTLTYEIDQCSYPVVFGVYGEFVKKRMELFPNQGGKLEDYAHCFDCDTAFEERSLLYLASVKNHKNVLLCGKCAPKYQGAYRGVNE